MARAVVGDSGCVMTMVVDRDNDPIVTMAVDGDIDCIVAMAVIAVVSFCKAGGRGGPGPRRRPRPVQRRAGGSP